MIRYQFFGLKELKQKMTKIVTYGIFIITSIIILSAPTCVDENYYESQRMSRIDSLTTAGNYLMSDSLSIKNLEAFEIKAIEKLMDYSDEVSIIYNQEFEQSFREQASRNVRSIFNSIKNTNNAIDQVKVFSLLPSPLMIIDSIKVTHPLRQESEDHFTGKIGYTEVIVAQNKTDTLELSRLEKRVTFHLDKIPKDFGENSMEVWEIRLGEITLLP